MLTILRRTLKSPLTKAISLRPVGYRTAVVGKQSKGSRIYASTIAMIGDVEGQVELGLWWRPPEMGPPVLAYAGFSKPEPLLRFHHKPRRRSINCYPIDGASRLFVEIRHFVDLEPTWHTLLQELDEVAKAERKNGRLHG